MEFEIMKTRMNGETLQIASPRQLDSTNANWFREQAMAALNDTHHTIEIDLAGTSMLDSCGLGALLSLHKVCGARNGCVRLRNPAPPVQQILELTRTNRIFEVVTE